jgi:alpha-amylase
VFWKDYFNYNLAQPDNNSGIDALIKAHEEYAGGGTQNLYCDEQLYIMERKGNEVQKGLVFVLNTAEVWNGTTVQTQWLNSNFQPLAWMGKDNADTPQTKQTDENGVSDFWAPPRGYVVYAPVQ